MSQISLVSPKNGRECGKGQKEEMLTKFFFSRRGKAMNTHSSVLSQVWLFESPGAWYVNPIRHKVPSELNKRRFIKNEKRTRKVSYLALVNIICLWTPVHEVRRKWSTGDCHRGRLRIQIFKACIFTYSLRQFFEPYSAQKCRACSTNEGSSKMKRDALCVPFHFWWNRRELNPCPKTSWYNLLRGQSYLLRFPSVIADRQAMTSVAFLCLTDTKANSRFRFTTDLTHGGSRSPHPRYGRHFWPRHSLRCKSNFVVVVYYLSWTV